MKYVWLILNWTVVMFSLAVGVEFTIILSPLPAIPLFLIAALFLPPVQNATVSRFGKPIPPMAKGILALVLFIGFVVLCPIIWNQKQQQKRIDEFNANRAGIIAKTSAALSDGRSQDVVSSTEKYVVAADSELNALRDQAQAAMKQQQDANRRAEILTELKGVPAQDYKRNRDLYKELVALSPNDESYSKKLSFYEKKYAEKVEQERVESEGICVTRAQIINTFKDFKFFKDISSKDEDLYIGMKGANIVALLGPDRNLKKAIMSLGIISDPNVAEDITAFNNLIIFAQAIDASSADWIKEELSKATNNHNKAYSSSRMYGQKEYKFTHHINISERIKTSMLEVGLAGKLKEIQSPKQESSNNQIKPNNKSEGTFTFECGDGITIDAHYTEMKDLEKFGRNQYLLHFRPLFKHTDGNIWAASLACVFNIFQEYYGQGGLFYCNPVGELTYDEFYKINAYYWKLPTGKGLYVTGLVYEKDNSDKIGAFLIYLK